MRTIGLEIEKLRQELRDKERRLAAIEELSRAYSDLAVHIGKDGVKRYVCESMNEYVNELEYIHLCTCCVGAPLVIWPFAVVEGVKVFSNPPHFTVAHSNEQGFGEIPEPGWKEAMLAAGIPKHVVLKVEDHLRRHPPVNYDTEK